MSRQFLYCESGGSAGTSPTKNFVLRSKTLVTFPYPSPRSAFHGSSLRVAGQCHPVRCCVRRAGRDARLCIPHGQRQTRFRSRTTLRDTSTHRVTQLAHISWSDVVQRRSRSQAMSALWSSTRPGVSTITGAPAALITPMSSSSGICPSPKLACRSRWEPASSLESFA